MSDSRVAVKAVREIAARCGSLMPSGKDTTSLMAMTENGTGLQGATLHEKVFREGFPEEVTCCAETQG